MLTSSHRYPVVSAIDAKPSRILLIVVVALHAGLAIAINVLRGRTQIDCGCFRNGMKQRISWAMVGRNVLLTAMALGAVALLHLARPAGVPDLAAGMMAGAVLFLLYFSASMLAGLPARQTTTASLKGR